MRKLFSLNFDLSSHLFCLNTLFWPGHCDLLPSMLGCFAFNSLPFISLDPHWPLWLSCWHLLGSVLPAPFLGCPAHSCWLSLVQSLASCAPACSMVSATLSILLTCSPLFIASHLAFHCLSLDVLLSSWWYEPSPYPPSQTPFPNPITIFACPIPFGHTARCSVSCSSHASRLRTKSAATNFRGNLIPFLRAPTFAGCNYLLPSSLRPPSCRLTWRRHAHMHARIHIAHPCFPQLFGLCNHWLTHTGYLLLLPLGTTFSCSRLYLILLLSARYCPSHYPSPSSWWGRACLCVSAVSFWVGWALLLLYWNTPGGCLHWIPSYLCMEMPFL